MTARDPRVTLTEFEREELRPFDAGFYSCDCDDERCPTLPCDNDRDDLLTSVERIIAARLAPIRALADKWHGSGSCSPSWCYACRLRAALDATGADLSASQDHDGAEGQGEGQRAGEALAAVREVLSEAWTLGGLDWNARTAVYADRVLRARHIVETHYEQKEQR